MSSGASPEGVVELGMVATEVNNDVGGSDHKEDDGPIEYSTMDNTEISAGRTFRRKQRRCYTE